MIYFQRGRFGAGSARVNARGRPLPTIVNLTRLWCRQTGGPGLTIDVSYFSLASLVSLALFLAIIIPRSLVHVVNLLAGRIGGRAVQADRWLIAIVVAILLCVGFGVAGVLQPAAPATWPPRPRPWR